MGDTQFHPPVGETLRQAKILNALTNNVIHERWRQIAKWGVQHHPDGTDPKYTFLADGQKVENDKAVADGTLTWVHILLEEVWEAFAETDPVKLREELVQVAAVALGWVEDIDSREAK